MNTFTQGQLVVLSSAFISAHDRALFSARFTIFRIEDIFPKRLLYLKGLQGINRELFVSESSVSLIDLTGYHLLEPGEKAKTGDEIMSACGDWQRINRFIVGHEVRSGGDIFFRRKV